MSVRPNNTYHVSYGFTDLDVNGLVYACNTGDLELLKKELANGTDVNSADPDGVTAIAYASKEKGFIEGVKLLLAAGADPTIEGRRPPFNAIRAACYFGHLDILQLYDKYLENEKILVGLFPGSFAISTYQFLGRYFKKLGLKVEGSQLTDEAQLPNCELQLNAILDSLPIEVNYQDAAGKTALHYYVGQAGLQPSMVKRLLDAGLDPNLKDQEGDTVLKTLRTSFHWNAQSSKEAAAIIRSYGGRYETVSGIRDWLRSHGF